MRAYISRFRSKPWWQQSIVYAVVISSLVHLGVILYQGQLTEPKPSHLKAPLAVVIVNSQSHLAPIAPRKLAQNDLNGGGQSEVMELATAVSAINPGIAHELEALQKEQTRLIAQVNQQKEMAQKNRVGKNTELMERADLLEAELAKRIKVQNARPRKAILTSTSAKAVIYAQYYDTIRKKVEQYGTKYFPRNSKGPLYGQLILLISIDASGKLVSKPKIEKSSGIAELDQQAIAIVNACAPFGKYSPAMMAKLDVIDWIATFNFVQGSAENGSSQLDLQSLGENKSDSLLTSPKK